MLRRLCCLWALTLLLAACEGGGDGAPAGTHSPAAGATATATRTEMPSASPTPTCTLTQTPTATSTPGGVTLVREGDTLRFSTRAAEARIDLPAFHLTLTDAAGELLAEQADAGLQFTAGDAEHAVGPVKTSELQGRTLHLTVETGGGMGGIDLTWRTDRTLELVFVPPDQPAVTHFTDAYRLQPDELIYGLTERLTDSAPIANFPGFPPIDELIPREVGSLNRRGESIEMLVRATFGVYAPFYHSSAGYGLYVAGTTIGQYDIGKTDPETLRFRFETGTTAESHTFRYDFFAGPDHATILDEYTALTGRPFLPPEWVFRHWRYRDEHAVGEPVVVDGVPINPQVAEDLLMYEAHGIPAGVYMIDRPWSEGPFGFANFLWDEVRFPNTGGMLDVLRGRGYRVTVWSAALAVGDRPGDNGTEARARGYFAPGVAERPPLPDARVIDLTNPDAREWWKQQHVEWVRQWNIDGLKLDRGEEWVPTEATDVWWDGRNSREVHNEHPITQARLYSDIMREVRGDDFVVFARAAYAGAQPYAVFWGGDTAGSETAGLGRGTDLGLRGVIISLQRTGFMGFPIWGTDTGGYYQFKDRDVFARWLEFSAFCPLMNIGGTGAHAPWNMPTEPRVDTEMIEIYRRYTQLHHDLVHYTVRHAAIAHQTGLPIARALVFAYPNDPQVRDRWDEYLYGDDILVAPVWRIGQRSREVYLPAGRWEDFWNRSMVFDGPLTFTADAPLDTIPVFIRAGADIPGRP